MCNNTPMSISDDAAFAKKFTFCTLVTDLDEYHEMVQSAKNKGFVGHDVEYMYFDNRQNNVFDGFSGINHAIRHAQGEYLIFCHQDILFIDDDRVCLEKLLEKLESKDHLWAVAGNAGKNLVGSIRARITDPTSLDVSVGDFPAKVMSLDENFLIINRKHHIYTSTPALKGFHLYGLDLCQNAINNKLNCYVIDFHLKHKSSGNINQSFYDIQNDYIDLQYFRKRSQFFYTTCTQFFVGHGEFFLSFIAKSKTLSRWRRSFLKRYSHDKIDKNEFY